MIITAQTSLRNCIGDNGALKPAPDTALYESPDLLAVGTPPDDLSATLHEANWNRIFHARLKAGTTGYFYMRGENTGTAEMLCDFALYATRPALLFWPEQWRNQRLQTADGKRIQQLIIQPGSRGITPEPFVWCPEETDRYSLVGIAGNDALPDLPLPGNSIRDYIMWIKQHPELAIQNLVVEDVNCPQWNTAVAYTHGDETTAVYVEVVCINVPAGAHVAIRCTDAAGEELFQLPDATVADSSFFVAGKRVEMPAGFSGTITYRFTAGEHPVPPGYSIMLRVCVPVAGSDDVLYPLALTPAEMGFPEPADYLEQKEAFRTWDTVHLEAHTNYAAYLQELYGQGNPVKRVVAGTHSTHAQILSPLARLFNR